ncbi:MAG: hypothetical protein HON74_03920 [Flavobacteriaceae bacterium]|jgi:hypothetical protein|nr:hypothetical protein [Flavobacteriaceae bacterium]
MEFLTAALILYIVYVGDKYRAQGYCAPYLTSCSVPVFGLAAILFFLASLILED